MERRESHRLHDVAHLGVGTASFALILRTDSTSKARGSVVRPSTDDPMTRGKRNREAERNRRECAKRTAEGAAELAALSVPKQCPTQGKMVSSFAGACKNKPCVRRNAMEDRLFNRWEEVKTELGRKVQRVHDLQRSVAEKEKQNNIASEEFSTLRDAVKVAEAGVEDRRRLSKAANERINQVTDELSCLRVELRKLRKRHKEVAQHCMPPPRGFIFESPHAWTTSEGELFAPDGLTVAFANNGRSSGRERGKRQAAAGWAGGGGGKSGAHKRAPAWQSPSCFDGQTRCDGQYDPREGDWVHSSVAADSPHAREHPGKFGRWGTEVLEQWSCCLWEKQENTSDIRSRRYRGVAEGCEAISPRSTSGGMTTADDVHLVWRRSSESAGCRSASDAFEAWEGGNSTGDWRQWTPKPTVGVGMNKRCAGAAWSLIRSRPETAHAKTRTVPLFYGPVRAGRENVPSVANHIGDNTASVGVASRSFGSPRPDSAPSKRLNSHPAVRHASSLKAFREARAEAGWKRIHSHFTSDNKSAQRDSNIIKGLKKRSASPSQAQGSLSHTGTVLVHSRRGRQEGSAGTRQQG